jgi:hypothetical protein
MADQSTIVSASFRLNTDGVQIFTSIADVLRKSQDSIAAHPKLIAKLTDVYNRSEFTIFFEKLLRCLQTVLISMQKNPNTDRCIDFLAKFASTLTTKTSASAASKTATNENTSQNQHDSTLVEGDDEATQAAGGGGGDESDHFDNPLFTSLLDFLITNSKASHDAVRYRCCHMLSKLMSAINNDQFIDEDVYDRLCDHLLERLKDINSRVQVRQELLLCCVFFVVDYRLIEN